MQDIIAQLLVRDPEKRLGSRAGAEEVKAHPFFSEIDWGLLRNTRFASWGDPMHTDAHIVNMQRCCDPAHCHAACVMAARMLNYLQTCSFVACGHAWQESKARLGFRT